MTTKWSGRLLEWGTSENSAETGDSPVFHGTMIWQIVKGLGPQQKASSSGNTNTFISQLVFPPLVRLHAMCEKAMTSAGISMISLMLLTNNFTLMNLGCQEQQALTADAGNKPIPRNLAMIQAWDDKWMLGSRTSGREWLFYLDTEQKKAFHSMAHQGVLLYTAGNISRGPRFTPVIMKYVVPLPNFESWKYIQSV